MDYMMEMSFECDNGNDAVCVYIRAIFVGYFSQLKICLLALCLLVNLTTFISCDFHLNHEFASDKIVLS